MGWQRLPASMEGMKCYNRDVLAISSQKALHSIGLSTLYTQPGKDIYLIQYVIERC